MTDDLWFLPASADYTIVNFLVMYKPLNQFYFFVVVAISLLAYCSPHPKPHGSTGALTSELVNILPVFGDLASDLQLGSSDPGDHHDTTPDALVNAQKAVTLKVAQPERAWVKTNNSPRRRQSTMFLDFLDTFNESSSPSDADAPRPIDSSVAATSRPTPEAVVVPLPVTPVTDQPIPSSVDDSSKTVTEAESSPPVHVLPSFLPSRMPGLSTIPTKKKAAKTKRSLPDNLLSGAFPFSPLRLGSLSTLSLMVLDNQY
ncbi:hypothetical protein PGT21_025093 [Puccinia graminis f. sp. tritici]|uniref:Uncharacterized protein n=1 Tax=Puccinia graminis f. sp. tritici TaxID=56615 RepID=A0A5B0ME92_PUCGR|nr:hypothetical protein PGT21_025093 [Puccinia graminis f. sp. tritici]